MEKITIDEQNKKRIQKFIKQEIGFYGYEKDIELLEQNGQLTEELAREVFTRIMEDAHRTRTMLEPEENSEFREEIEETFARYDEIPKPEHFEEYGFYDGGYNNMELDDIYSNMQIAFELRELDNKYYGCRDLRNIAETVINSIDGIEKYQIELQPEAKEKLQRIQEELRTLLSAEKTDIQGIQERIELYNGHATNIWNDYLTDIDDAKNSQYRWVIHNLTKGELEGNFRNKYMSTSLMTNNAMGRYGNSDYGLIIKPKHIVSASYKDTYTLNTTDDEEKLFNIKPPLMLPQEVEDICIQQTIEENGEMLNYETTPIYSELVVDEYEIEGVYYISYGEHELAKDYERAKKVADERGLPLIERDISKYRAEHGLKPMTEKSKKNLCRNVLWKCCAGDKELVQIYSQFSEGFIDNHFQEFYEQFMQIKENQEYSKEDILRTFSDITRGDIDFGRISQNIDEMYLSAEEQETLQAMQEYGLTGIEDKKTLQRKLEKGISDGIFYSADLQNTEKLKRFEIIKKAIPQFEEFKEVYLQLKVAGIEDELYNNIDFNNISYAELLERATKILKERTKTSEKQEENVIGTTTESIIPPSKETVQVEEILDSGARINEFGEIIRENNTGENIIQNIPAFEDIIQEKTTSKQLKQTQQTSQVVEDYWNETHSKQGKTNGQQQLEKIRPIEKSIRDEVGDELKNTEQQIEEKSSQTTDLWLNRFNRWYSAIDRISQKAKAKFVKMKSDIIKVISEKLKERNNHEQINTQEQDTNER